MLQNQVRAAARSVPLRNQGTMRLWSCAAAIALSSLACAGGATMSTVAPNPDPRVGLKPGLFDAGSASWNLRLVSSTPPQGQFTRDINSDLAFSGHYVIMGNYNGFQIFDVTNPSHPVLQVGYYCPASQSDVSVYRNLLFVSGEGTGGRLDCGDQGVHDSVSALRLRGIRIFDITDVVHPKYIANVQTCRGSHTNTLLLDPNDTANVYIYVSGSAGVRSPSELAGCSKLALDQDPNSALFRIEVIKVPLADPTRAAIVSSPRIFNDLTAPARHGEAPEDIAAAARTAAAARAKGMFTARFGGVEFVLPQDMAAPLLDSVMRAHGGTGTPTAADSATLRGSLQGIIDARFGPPPPGPNGSRPGPNQCHDITVYPAIGLAGGACGGYGLVLDIRDAAHPRRIGAVSDSNFSFWHSATFSNDGTKLLFSDEWGGGNLPKCRATDRKEWGADAIFTVVHDTLRFQSYYKMPAPQTSLEICVAHNGSLIPIPGRDIMVQAWYEGGISMFDWTDPAHPQEIGFFDRGPSDATKLGDAGFWSAYWYNGYIYGSEEERGLDVFELIPSGFISQNEIDAAKSVRLDSFNAQDQPRFVWPASFVLARAYCDQLARSGGLAQGVLAGVRRDLGRAERLSGKARTDALTVLATRLLGAATGSSDQAKVRLLAATVTDLAGGGSVASPPRE
jgi:hypothetical protein